MSPGAQSQLEESKVGPSQQLARLPPEQPFAMKQKQRQIQGTKERFNGGKMRKPWGLTIIYYFPDIGWLWASEEC